MSEEKLKTQTVTVEAVDDTVSKVHKLQQRFYTVCGELFKYIEFIGEPMYNLMLEHYFAQFILAYIHTMNNIYKEPAKLTYEHFIELYGMSRETVCAGLKLLIKLGIIERVKQSRYKIIAKYNRKNYVEIDVYWLKREWEINGKKKRLARSRFLNLALLKRSVTNPKTDGVFISSQERIGKAVNRRRRAA